MNLKNCFLISTLFKFIMLCASKCLLLAKQIFYLTYYLVSDILNKLLSNLTFRVAFNEINTSLTTVCSLLAKTNIQN